MLDAILMALGFEGPGALLAIIAGAAAVVLGAWWRGKQAGEDARAADDAQAYRETRQEIDNADLGHGATDRQRIDSLRAIANRRGAGKD